MREVRDWLTRHRLDCRLLYGLSSSLPLLELAVFDPAAHGVNMGSGMDA